MKRNDGGYVLVYVVVVIVILCLLVPAACANSLQNLKAQQASIERTRQLYEAEGQIERFVAEVKAQAEKLKTEGYPYDKSDTAVEEAEKAFAGKVVGIVREIDGSTMENEENFSPAWTAENGEYRCKVTITSTAGAVTIRSDIAVSLTIQITETLVEKEDVSEWKYGYVIEKCTIDYESYNISTTAEPETQEVMS